MKRKRIAVISARGGSKGIPRKNIVDVCGKPLIAYSIEPAVEALKNGIIDKLIVSTDDEEIAEVSRKYGAEVPFMRPADMASDKAKSVDLMIHAADYFEQQGERFDDMILLQPTSPLRTYADIEKAFEIYTNEQADSLISCYCEEDIIETGLYHKDGNMAVPLNAMHNAGTRRQDLPKLYVRNGAIFLVNIAYMKDEHKVFGGKVAMYEMPKERSVNIDTFTDLEVAKEIIRKKLCM